MSYQHILLQRADGIATLTLNRPETRNSMTPAMGDEVVRAVEELRADTSIRVTILTGSGKSFSSGGDLGMLARDAGLAVEGDAPTMAGSPKDFYARYLSIRSLPMPTIAAINGHAVGAGLCIALACDLRVAVADAKMGMTFTKLGIHPGMGGTYFLPRLVGNSRACELFFTGRLFDAVEAESMGLLSRAVPREQFESTVQDLAQQIAAAGPVANRMVKKAIYRSERHTLEEALDYEGLQQGITFTTADAKEGVRAIMEKREPKFVGK